MHARTHATKDEKTNTLEEKTHEGVKTTETGGLLGARHEHWKEKEDEKIHARSPMLRMMIKYIVTQGV